MMRMRHIQIRALILLWGVIAILSPLTPVFAFGNAEFTFSSASTHYAVGDTFTITVGIDPHSDPVNVVRAVMNFPSMLVRVNSFTLGTDFPFLSPPGMTIDNAAGYMNVGGYILNTYHTAPKTFGTLSVTALATGTATFSMAPGSHLISPDQQERWDGQPQSITITIGTPPPPANRTPVFSPRGVQQVTTGNTVSFTVQATDPDGDLVTLSASALPTGASFTPGTPAVTTTGVFSWTPSATGTYTATFSATDNGSPALVAQQTVTIQVNAPVNPPPQFQAIPPQSITLGSSVDLTVSASDPIDTVQLSWTLPNGASVSNVVNNAPNVSARLIWTPTEQGVYYAIFTATDDSPFGPQSATLTIPFYVNVPANSAPTISPLPEIVANAYEPVSFTVTATDASDPVILTALVPDGATFTPGAPAQTVNGTFTWTPTVNGIYLVLFSAQDTNQFNPLTTQRTVRITVFGGTCPTIDVPSCAALTGSACPTLPDADLLQCEPIQDREREPVLTTAQAPRVYSLTHPVQEQWYRDHRPEIRWELDAQAIGASVAIDQSPDAIPGTGLVPQETTSYSFVGLTDGIWYAHVRQRYAIGVSPVAHYRFNIDTTAPRILPPVVERIKQADDEYRFRVSVNALDPHAGIATYEYAVDSASWRIASFPYTLTRTESGGAVFRLRVTDRAGNVAETEFNLSEAVTRAKVAVPYVAATPLVPPTIHPRITRGTKGFFVVRDVLILTGTATPRSRVTLTISSPEKTTLSQYSTMADVNGRWVYHHLEPLNKGDYRAWGVITQNSITSSPSFVVTLTLPTDFNPIARIHWIRVILFILLPACLIGALIGRFLYRHASRKKYEK